MNDPIELRKKIRAALALRPRYEFTEIQHFEAVQRLCVPPELDLEEFLRAREWNHEKNFIEYRLDEDLERDVWSLTDQGKLKEGVK